MKLHSLRAYVGEPQTGKTYTALQHLERLTHNGAAGIVVDSIGAKNFRSMRRAGSLEHLIQWSYGVGGLTAWTPEEDGDLEKLRLAVMASKRETHILVDEASRWIRAGRLIRPLDLLCRTLAHAGSTLALTTQNISADCGRALLTLGPQIFIFRLRVEMPITVRAALQIYGLDPARLPSLKVGEFLVYGGS